MSLQEQLFESKEELFKAVKDLLKEFDIEIISKVDHDYHFIIEISIESIRIGRLSIYYNRFYKCTAVHIINPVKPEHYEILSSILPIKKKNIIENDPFIDYLHTNYHFKITKIYETDFFTCYEIIRNNVEVWVKIVNRKDLQCQYVKGDFKLFDYLQYIIEDEIRTLQKQETIGL
nr:hypothetical protein [Paenibacillus bovis]